MDKDVVHDAILYNHKKNDILAFVKTWMELESIKLSQIRHSERDKYRIGNLINKTNEQRKKRETNQETDS